MLKVEPFFHVTNLRILMCSCTVQSRFKTLESLYRKLTSRFTLIGDWRNQAGELLKKFYAQQHLALSTASAEYCDPALCRCNHTAFIDKPINNALRLITGCLSPTPTNSLFVLAEKRNGGFPTKTSQDRLNSASCTKESNHLLHDRFHSRLTKQQSHLKSICACCA